MRVRITLDAMGQPDVFRYLDRVLDALFDERHYWDEQDPAAVEGSAWASGDAGRAGQRVREAVEKLLATQLYEGRDAAQATSMHAVTLTISLTAAPPLALSPAEAVKALEMPAFVVVENGESDRAFLEGMIRAFGRPALKAALDRGFWEIVSAGGGGEIPKRVAEIVTKIGNGPRRVLILSDSDRLVPGEPTKTEMAITTCALAHGVTAVVLSKREIENYLPYDALWDMSGKRQKCNSFLVLNQGQRDHYDMKKGFRADKKTKRAVLLPSQQGLFGGVRPHRVLDDLMDGFGDKVWRCFQSTKLDERAVRLSCPSDEGEVARLLDAIEGLI